jgi:glycosyltransferase involved in cell wall biosynthesis
METAAAHYQQQPAPWGGGKGPSLEVQNAQRRFTPTSAKKRSPGRQGVSALLVILALVIYGVTLLAVPYSDNLSAQSANDADLLQWGELGAGALGASSRSMMGNKHDSRTSIRRTRSDPDNRKPHEKRNVGGSLSTRTLDATTDRHDPANAGARVAPEHNRVSNLDSPAHLGTLYDVCIVSADPFFLPSSRGTAGALLQVALLAQSASFSVSVLSLAETPEDCKSAHKRYSSSKHAFSFDCVHLSNPQSHPWHIWRSWGRYRRYLHTSGTSCRVIITHEWWGLAQTVAIRTFLGTLLPPSMSAAAASSPMARIIVNVHGGYEWATSIAPYSRVGDFMMDAEDRAGTAVADAIIFPTQYMHDFHRDQRKWVMPEDVRIISNLPGFAAPSHGGQRTVKGFAYIGALSWRKGIDTFLEAIEGIPLSPNFVIHIIGSADLNYPGFDGMALLDAIKERMGDRAQYIYLHPPMLSGDLWEFIKEEQLAPVYVGRLENEPMVVMEAAAHGCPMLSADIGGIREMLVPHVADALLVEPNRPGALGERMEQIAREGKAMVPILSSFVSSSDLQWAKLISEYVALSHGQGGRETGSSTGRLGQLFAHPVVMTNPASVLHLDLSPSLDVVEAHVRYCGKEGLFELEEASGILMKPPGYSFISGNDAEVRMMLANLVRSMEGSPLKALISSILMPTGELRFGSLPFAFLSHGWGTCFYEVPILVHKDEFCAFTGSFTGGPLQVSMISTYILYGTERQTTIGRLPFPLFRWEGQMAPEHDCFDPFGTQVEDLRSLFLGDWKGRGTLDIFPLLGRMRPILERGLLAHGKEWEDLVDKACHRVDRYEWKEAARSLALCDEYQFDDPYEGEARMKHSLLSECGAWCLCGNGGDDDKGWYLNGELRCFRKIGHFEGDMACVDYCAGVVPAA